MPGPMARSVDFSKPSPSDEEDITGASRLEQELTWRPHLIKISKSEKIGKFGNTAAAALPFK